MKTSNSNKNIPFISDFELWKEIIKNIILISTFINYMFFLFKIFIYLLYKRNNFGKIINIFRQSFSNNKNKDKNKDEFKKLLKDIKNNKEEFKEVLKELFKEDIQKLCKEENKNLENKIQKHIQFVKLTEISKDLYEQMQLIRININEIDKKISENKINEMRNEIKSQIIKMMRVFIYLNNIRLIIMSRKYINRIIKNEIENNDKLRISKIRYLMDVIAFKFEEYNKIKKYLKQFIVQIGDKILPQNQYNLTLDFLFFNKNYLNNEVHMVDKNGNISDNNIFKDIFEEESKNSTDSDELQKKNDLKHDKKDDCNNRNSDNTDQIDNLSKKNYINNYKDIKNDLKINSNKIKSDQNKIILDNKIYNNNNNNLVNNKDYKFNANNNNSFNIENNDLDRGTQVENICKKDNTNPNLLCNNINNDNIVVEFNDLNIKDVSNKIISDQIKIVNEDKIYKEYDASLLLEKNAKEISDNIKEMINIDKTRDIEELVINELNNKGIGNIDEIDINKKISFSLHDIEDNSLKNFKRIFFNFFFKKKDEYCFNFDNILQKIKEEINFKYITVITNLNSCDNIYTEILEDKNLSNNFDDLEANIISIGIHNIKNAKNNINKIKYLVENLKKKLIEYLDHLVVFIAFKYQVEEVYKKIMDSKEVFEFQKIFNVWKNEFSEEYINKIKMEYQINKDVKILEIKIEQKNILKFEHFEYLKLSKDYKKYIDEDELEKITSKDMLENIDKLVEGKNLDLYGTDEELDYKKLKQLEEK